MKAKISGQLKGLIDVSDIPIVVEVHQHAETDHTGKTCAHCGTPFISNRKEAKYCSKSCRQKAYYHRQKQEEERKAQRSFFQRVRDWIGNQLIRIAKKLKGEGE